MGIPIGNTVALAGDPGTGKTTFLLNFFKFGYAAPEKGICLGPENGESPDKGAGDFYDGPNTPVSALKAFDDLIELPKKNDKSQETSTNAGGKQKVLRCFVSLETTFERICTSHKRLLFRTRKSSSNPFAPDDIVVFIDATSLLSGRLEDQLRYSRLPNSSQTENSGNIGDMSEGCDPEIERWHQRYDLSLGGYETGGNENFGLYWQKKNGAPERIEQLIEDGKKWEECPFFKPNSSSQNESGTDPNRLRLYNLITPPLDSPMKRARLIKDLLAEILIRFKGSYDTAILAVDSLSALLADLGGSGEDDALQGRRLHILNLVRWLEENQITSMMACEAVRDSQHTLQRQPLFLGTQERYIASGVIQLDYHEYRSGDLIRYLRVLKMRGAGHDMRSHAYDLGRDGLAWIEPLFAEPAER